MRGGRKDNPCSRSHAVKNNSSMKNSFDIFFKQDASTVFWNRAQNEFERFAAKPRGCKSFFKMVFNPQKWTCRPWLQTQSDWDTLYKKSSFTILFPTSSFPLNFTLMSYTDLLNSIRVNNFLLFLPVCIWIMPFTISSVWSTVQSHFPTLNTVIFQLTTWGCLYQSAAPWPLSIWIYLYRAKEHSGNKCNYLQRWQYHFSPITSQYAITRNAQSRLYSMNTSTWCFLNEGQQSALLARKDCKAEVLPKHMNAARSIKSVWILIF